MVHRDIVVIWFPRVVDDLLVWYEWWELEEGKESPHKLGEMIVLQNEQHMEKKASSVQGHQFN